jgi:antitoxin component of MazEF toxin-antitoxin module
MPISRRVAKQGNSIVLNLGSDLSGALEVEPGDSVQIVVIGNFMLVAKENFPYHELVEAAIKRLDGGPEYILKPKEPQPNRSERAVLAAMRRLGHEADTKMVADEAGLKLEYVHKLLSNMASRGIRTWCCRTRTTS